MNLLMTFTLVTGETIEQSTSDFATMAVAADKLSDLVKTNSAITLAASDRSVHVVSSRHVVSVLVEPQSGARV